MSTNLVKKRLSQAVEHERLRPKQLNAPIGVSLFCWPSTCGRSCSMEEVHVELTYGDFHQPVATGLWVRGSQLDVKKWIVTQDDWATERLQRIRTKTTQYCEQWLTPGYVRSATKLKALAIELESFFYSMGIVHTHVA